MKLFSKDPHPKNLYPMKFYNHLNAKKKSFARYEECKCICIQFNFDEIMVNRVVSSLKQNILIKYSLNFQVGLGLLKRILDDSPRQIELLLEDEESSSSSQTDQNSPEDREDVEIKKEGIQLY